MTLPRLGDSSLPLDVDHCARVMEALFDIDAATTHEGSVQGTGSFLNCYHSLGTKRIAFVQDCIPRTLQHPDLETAYAYLQEQGLLPEPKVHWHFSAAESLYLDGPRHPTSLLDLLTLAFFGPRRLRTIEELVKAQWSALGLKEIPSVLWLVYSPRQDMLKPMGQVATIDLWDLGFHARAPQPSPMLHTKLSCFIPTFIQAYVGLP